METIDFNAWFDGVPVVDADSDADFHGWLDGAPVVDNPGGGAPPPPSVRRRTAFIF